MPEEAVQIVGAEHLAELGRRFKAAGDGELRKELLAAIRTAGKKVIPRIPAEADSILPRGGGLAAEAAGQKFAVRTSLATGVVKIVGSGMKSMSSIDEGTVRHPLPGNNRSRWFAQKVTPGFFSKPILEAAPEFRHEIEDAMSGVAHKLERPL